MGFTHYPLPQNNGNLPLPFLGRNHPIVLLDNIYQWLYMYMNWFTWIIFSRSHMLYEKMGVTIIIQFCQRKSKLKLPH